MAKEIPDLGVAVEKTLGEANAVQEVAVKNLPPATVKAWLAKGLLYVALEQINKAGAMANEETDPQRAAAYDMRIRYRNVGQKKKDDGGDEKK